MIDPLQPLIEAMYGPGASFRTGQREAIEEVAQDGHRVLVVQRTGWGKSLVYWVATRLRRDAGHGPTLIVSPLLSLMRNQIDMAKRLGLEARTINSTNQEDWDQIAQDLAANQVDVLLISPERFGNEGFSSRLLPSIQGSIGLLVIDEAHCISDWGHDFRPDYRRIARILPLLSPIVPVLATTATANDRVVEDVVEQLGGGDVKVLRGPLARESLRLDAIELDDQAERMGWLADNLPKLPESGIIYCLTVADSERVAGWLQSRGIDARAYHARQAPDLREALERALIDGEVKALVATVALGMGFDKPDLGFVIHYQRPGSIIGYYQQVGRAGRAIDRSYGILLAGREDDEIADYFIETAFPPTVYMEDILTVLAGSDSMRLQDIQARVNLPRGRIEQALKLLEMDGAVIREKGRYYRTPNPWVADEERIERVKATRRAELDQMRAYVRHPGCRMAFLTDALDDPNTGPCGRCANDVGKGMPRDVPSDLVEAARTFLRRDHRVIAPRKRWAHGTVEALAGSIGTVNEPGFSLCRYGDAGWGRQVQADKVTRHTFGDDVIQAAADVIRQWPMEHRPTWVTAVPSSSDPGLVGDLARGIAVSLGLDFVDTLRATRSARAQKSMQNSVQQLRNAYEKLSIDGSVVRPDPVLLIDDLVDSKWTMTVAGWLLRSHGSGPVYPFALADSSGSGDEAPPT